MVRLALALALTGAIAVLSGGLLLAPAGSAGSAQTADTPCVPSEAWTETTDWLLQPPGEGWRLVDQRTVVDSEAYDEVVTVGYTNWTWHPGPGWEDTDPLGPPWPDTEKPSYWSSNEGDHGGHPQPGDPAVNSRGNYYMSNDNSGNGDWFHWEAVTETVHHDAVTHEEFRYAFDHPAVVCPTEPPTTQPPTTQPPTTQPPTTQPPVTQPPAAEPPDVLPGTGTSPEANEPAEEEAEVLGAEATRTPTPQAEVPTAVDAGLSAAPDPGTPAARQWGVVLVATGLVLLASAGGVARVRVRRT